jgi:DNA polymerase III subunit delta
MQAFNTLLSKIKQEQFSPFYLLSGTESYFIDAITNALMDQLVNEQSRDFDFTLFYGKEAISAEIIETAKRYPMIAPYNVVIVKEAQFMPPSSWDDLAAYVENPTSQSIVVFCFKHKAFDKRKKLYKAAERVGEVLTVKPLYDNQISKWISDEAKSLNIDLSPAAATMLSEYIGANLSALHNELVKLQLVVKNGETITPDHIETHVGISKEFNSFELQKAIGLGQFSKAFQIIQYLNRNPKNHPLVLTLATLHNYFQKLLLLKGLSNPAEAPKVLGVNPFFVKEYQSAAARFSMKQITQAMSSVLDADLKSKGIKGVNTTPQQIMEELLLKLFTL